MAAPETRSGFSRNAAQRASFTRFACSLRTAGMARYYARDIAISARNLASGEFGSESAYAQGFRADIGPIIAFDGQRRITARVVNENHIASIVELGPKNPGPRPQGGRSGGAHHILARAAQSHATSGIHGQA